MSAQQAQTLDQKMAQTARQTVSRRKGKDYRNACEALPPLLMQCGLLPVLAWLGSSKQTCLKELREDMLQHLSNLGYGKNSAIEHWLREASSAEYQVCFELALRAAVWQKRMAKALIPKESTSENTGA